MRKPRQTRPVPRTSLWASTIRPGWTFFAELGQFLLCLGACVAVFLFAGGSPDDFDRFGDTADLNELRPLFAALTTFVVLGISDLITGLVGRARHNRHVNDWYARMHPEEVPSAVQIEHIGELLAADGPKTADEIHRALTDGGPWSGVRPLSRRGVLRALGTGDGRRPEWLVHRASAAAPYSHLSNPYEPERVTVSTN